jgi:hypothetical protein
MLTTAELERLIASFNAATVTVEQLVKSSNEIIETNRELKAMIDTKAYLEHTQGDILKNLTQQNILYKSLIYLMDSDKETVKEIMSRAAKSNDKEVVAFWQKRLNDGEQ